VTGELETPARPDTLRALFNVRVGEFGKQQYDIKIRDDSGRPLWLIYPGRDRRIDVVALPLPMSDDDPVMTMCPINTLTSPPLRIRIGMDVFILGYPFGAAPPAFPVWKRGSIASEPDLVRLTTGYYLVDTASRPGMSGAPVILRSWTNDNVEGSVRAITVHARDEFHRRLFRPVRRTERGGADRHGLARDLRPRYHCG
jgi:hypothetical protein